MFLLEVIERGVSLGPGFKSTSPEKFVPDPNAEPYLARFKSYMEIKTKKEKYADELEHSKREDWDKYTKGPESYHKKGIEMKTIINPAPKCECEFSAITIKPITKNIDIKVSKTEDEVLKTLKPKDREAFISLREIYNHLDKVNYVIRNRMKRIQ